MKLHAYRPGPDGEPVKRSTDAPAWSPIARYGETEYASLHRSRSGQDAGEIEYGIRVSAIANLCPADKAKLLRTAEAMLGNIRKYCAE